MYLSKFLNKMKKVSICINDNSPDFSELCIVPDINLIKF